MSTIRVCAECGEEIQVVSAGDESWDWCWGCQALEPNTEEVEDDEFNNRLDANG